MIPMMFSEILTMLFWEKNENVTSILMWEVIYLEVFKCIFPVKKKGMNL